MPYNSSALGFGFALDAAAGFFAASALASSLAFAAAPAAAAAAPEASAFLASASFFAARSLSYLALRSEKLSCLASFLSSDLVHLLLSASKFIDRLPQRLGHRGQLVGSEYEEPEQQNEEKLE